jgi:NhaP-type Na+/H+ or K+/H+ antiporter
MVLPDLMSTLLLPLGAGGTDVAITISLAAIVVLGVGAQWLGWRLRLPSILLLLLFGFLAGPVMGELFGNDFALRPDDLVPEAVLLNIVSLAVGLILFEGGLTLNFNEIKNVRKAVFSLVTVGAIITWVICGLAAWLILGLPGPIAVLLGAVLIVTGPTVIGPLLRFVRPTGSAGKVLKWEGIVIDPIGAMAAVLVFEAIMEGTTGVGSATATSSTLAFVWGAVKTSLLGTGIGLAAAGLLVWLLRRLLIPDHLQVPVTLMFVTAAFLASNATVAESGLYTTTVMGIALANQKKARISHILEFKETLVLLMIAGLFIILSSRLEMDELRQINPWTAAAFIAVVILISRPAAVFGSTFGSALTFQDKLFLSWMAPRGIVAAAVASVFGIALEKQNVPGAELLVPYVFLVIVFTVSIYGLTAAFAARRLGLARTGSAGMLIVGAHPLARQIGLAMKEVGLEVLLVDTNYLNVQQAKLQGLNAIVANALSPTVTEQLELSSIGRMLALTGNHEINSLACVHFGRQFSRSEVYMLGSGRKKAPGRDGETDEEVQGRHLFGDGVTYAKLLELRDAGAEVRLTKITKEFSFEDWQAEHGETAQPLAVIGDDGTVMFYLANDRNPTPKPGQRLMGLVVPKPIENPRPAATAEEPATVPAGAVAAGV